MKLLTLNCHSYEEENQLEKMKYIAKVIVEENIEIVALQEINQYMDDKIIYGDIRVSNFAMNLVRELKSLGIEYNFTWDFTHYSFSKYEEGVGFLYRGEILEKQGKYIGSIQDKDYWNSRKFSMISKVISGEIVDFYSVHLGWWDMVENPYQEQVNELLDFANNRGNRYFLLGDFNSPSHLENEGYSYLLSKNIFDTYHLAEEVHGSITIGGVIDGWDAEVPQRIDYIFTSEKIAVKSSKVIFNGINRELVSDHYGVIIEI